VINLDFFDNICYIIIAMEKEKKIRELAKKTLELLEELEKYIKLDCYGIELQDELYLLLEYGRKYYE